MNEPKNQGEGDRASARRYDRHVERFVADGSVEPAAKSAEAYVEDHPERARAAERKAARGPQRFPRLDELVAKAKDFVAKLRARYAPKK
jgi:hypothetical protein